MKLDDMKTPMDALRWALHRIETAGLGCGDYFARAEELLNAAPGLPVEVYCYWPDGGRQHMEFDRWPQREQLPVGAVSFDIAWPDPRVEARFSRADWAACMRKKLDDVRQYQEAEFLPDLEPPNAEIVRLDAAGGQSERMES